MRPLRAARLFVLRVGRLRVPQSSRVRAAWGGASAAPGSAWGSLGSLVRVPGPPRVWGPLPPGLFSRARAARVAATRLALPRQFAFPLGRSCGPYTPIAPSQAFSFPVFASVFP